MISSLRALPDRVPLRVTLVTSVLVLVTMALGASGAAGTYAVRGFLVQRVDDQLGQAAQMVQDLRATYGEESDDLLRNYLSVPVGWAALGMAIVNQDGAGDGFIFTDNRKQTPPRLPQVDIATAHAKANKPFDARPVSGRGHDWRVLIRPLANDSGAVIVAITLDEVDDTVGKLAAAHIVIGAIVLAVLAIVGYAMVRTSLRRLVQAERTAREIAAGDLSRRVPAGHPDTEVGRLAAAFNAMLGEIEHAFRARERSEAEARASEARMRRFAADASHELRTPLTAIRGFAELYRQGGGEPAHVIGRIEHHATRMSALVEDLLLLARLDQRRPVEQAPVDLLVLAADAVQDIAVTRDDHPVRLIANAPRPPIVIGDELQLRQVIGNLLNNAVQHTPAGTPVTVTVEVYTWLAGAPAGEVVLSVADAGPGLAPDDAARVFERFFRTDPSRTRTEPSQPGRTQAGSGLGLSIVHALVSAHGGIIRLETAPDAGARFVVRLPLFVPTGELDDAGPDGDPDDAVDIDLGISTQPEAS
jgi:two-component system OmpR family sensor kinase